MPALAIPTIQQLKEFYPTTASLEDSKIAEVCSYVKNHIFLKMFGYQASQQIIDGTILDSASPTFMGFQKFLALCTAYQQEKDPLMSTNFGSKIISRPNVVDPSNQQKSITLIDLEGSIGIHYKEALKLVNESNCAGVPSWSGYFAYKVSRL